MLIQINRPNNPVRKQLFYSTGMDTRMVKSKRETKDRGEGEKPGGVEDLVNGQENGTEWRMLVSSIWPQLCFLSRIKPLGESLYTLKERYDFLS